MGLNDFNPTATGAVAVYQDDVALSAPALQLGTLFDVEAGAELVFPMPFIKDGRQFRPVVFVDAGNVFQTKCFDFSVNCFGFDVNEFRYATGVALTWLAGLGPMTFSYAFVFNDSPVDRIEQFQFELGRTF